MSQRGFSLLELMIVVAIIGILTLIAYPFYQDYVARVTVAEALAETNDIKNQLNGAYMEGGEELLNKKIVEINSTSYEWAVVDRIQAMRNDWWWGSDSEPFTGFTYKVYFKQGALPDPFGSNQRSVSVATVMNSTYVQCKDPLCAPYAYSSDPDASVQVLDSPVMFCGQGRGSEKVMYENIPRRWLPTGCRDSGIDYGELQKDGALDFWTDDPYR